MSHVYKPSFHYFDHLCITLFWPYFPSQSMEHHRNVNSSVSPIVAGVFIAGPESVREKGEVRHGQIISIVES